MVVRPRPSGVYLPNLLQTASVPTNALPYILCILALTLSNPIFLPPAYSPALIYFGWERSWWITCNYPTVLKRKTETERVQPALYVG
jgi:hypothetical protein